MDWFVIEKNERFINFIKNKSLIIFLLRNNPLTQFYENEAVAVFKFTPEERVDLSLRGYTSFYVPIVNLNYQNIEKVVRIKDAKIQHNGINEIKLFGRHSQDYNHPTFGEFFEHISDLLNE